MPSLAPGQPASPRASSAPPVLPPGLAVLPPSSNPFTDAQRLKDIEEYTISILDHLKEKDCTSHFTPEAIQALAVRAEKFVTGLNIVRKSSEVRYGLALLPMYELAILIDDSSSMKFDEGGIRITILQQILEIIAHFYSLSQADGKIKAVRFLNKRVALDNVTPSQLNDYIKTHRYDGLTRIGKELEKKILKPLVTPAMTRPLLVMVLTDGDIDGEPAGHLQKVIHDCIKRIQPSHGKFVSFQFSRIGNDPGAQKLLDDLDNHEELDEYIDTMPVGINFRLADDPLKKNQVMMIAKLMMGAISESWDETDWTEEDMNESKEYVRVLE